MTVGAHYAGTAARKVFASAERRVELDRERELKTAEAVAERLGNMKGALMKLGQMASYVDDALPAPLREALAQLQSNAPPMSAELAAQVIERSLGAPPEQLFVEWDPQPIAAASIGQVHRAVIIDPATGQERAVAVKVQYPGVDEAIAADLRNADMIGVLMKQAFNGLDPAEMVAEIKERITDELDYRLEARNQALFRQLWDGHPLIRVPRVHAAHTTKRVLCTEFVRGFGFYDYLAAANAREKRIASATIADFVFDSMFCHLVYNGDPHPGNYLFHEDGAVTFIDFGCVKRFTPAAMTDLKAFFRATIEGDRATFDAFILKIGLVRNGRDWDKDLMWRAWRYHLEPYWSGEFAFSPEYLARGREVMAPRNTKDMNLPPDLLFFTRITFGLNAIAQQLGSAGNFNKSARRHFYQDDQSPSALGLVGIEVPSHFHLLPHTAGAGEIVGRIEREGGLPSWPDLASAPVA